MYFIFLSVFNIITNMENNQIEKKSFEEFNIPTPLLNALENLNLIKATEIQEKSLPDSL